MKTNIVIPAGLGTKPGIRILSIPKKSFIVLFEKYYAFAGTMMDGPMTRKEFISFHKVMLSLISLLIAAAYFDAFPSFVSLTTMVLFCLIFALTVLSFIRKGGTK
jgi:uncharacterized membrane protein YoaK (UPF0700 family)